MITLFDLFNLLHADQFHTEINPNSTNHLFLFKDINLVLFHILYENKVDYITFVRAINAKLGIMHDLINLNPHSTLSFASNYKNIHNFDFFYNVQNSSIIHFNEIKQITFSNQGYNEYTLMDFVTNYDLNNVNKHNKLIIDIGCREVEQQCQIMDNISKLTEINKDIKLAFDSNKIVFEKRNFLLYPEKFNVSGIVNHIDKGFIKLLKK